jgi:hypothetical protein
VLEHRPQVAAVRPGDLTVPGADGVIPSSWDDAEPSLYGLTLHVRGRDVDGLLPVGQQAPAVLERNLDTLMHLFRGSPHRLKTVQRVVGESGEARQFQGKVLDVIAPTVTGVETDATVSVSFTIPSGYWEDLAPQEWNQFGAVPGTPYGVTTLAGATAPIHDGVIMVTGPLNGPAVRDLYTGARVSLGMDLPAGERWLINSGTWASRTAPTAQVTLTSPDTIGVDRSALTSFQGGTTRYLTLTPEAISPGNRAVRLVLEGTGATIATGLHFRGRRRFLL